MFKTSVPFPQLDLLRAAASDQGAIQNPYGVDETTRRDSLALINAGLALASSHAGQAGLKATQAGRDELARLDALGGTPAEGVDPRPALQEFSLAQAQAGEHRTDQYAAGLPPEETPTPLATMIAAQTAAGFPPVTTDTDGIVVTEDQADSEAQDNAETSTDTDTTTDTPDAATATDGATTGKGKGKHK